MIFFWRSEKAGTIKNAKTRKKLLLLLLIDDVGDKALFFIVIWDAESQRYMKVWKNHLKVQTGMNSPNNI